MTPPDAVDPLDPFDPLVRGLILFDSDDVPRDEEAMPEDPMRPWFERFHRQIDNERVKWSEMSPEQQVRLAFTAGWVARLLHELAETDRQEVRA
jgi:hypothetical protein